MVFGLHVEGSIRSFFHLIPSILVIESPSCWFLSTVNNVPIHRNRFPSLPPPGVKRRLHWAQATGRGHRMPPSAVEGVTAGESRELAERPPLRWFCRLACEKVSHSRSWPAVPRFGQLRGAKCRKALHTRLDCRGLRPSAVHLSRSRFA